MKKFFSALSIILSMIMLAGCAGGQTPSESVTEAAETQPEATQTLQTETETTAESATETLPETTEETKVQTMRDKEKLIRVLFIGNSFTYYNDMNQPNGIFYNIATKAGYNVEVSTVYKGGYYINQFLDPTDEYGAKVLSILKSKTKYDIVIVQDQSANPIADPGDFYQSVREMKELIDANGGEMWLYSTWGYKAGHSSLSTYGKDTYDMEYKLRAAYMAIGQELNVPVVYAGAAMSDMYRDNPKHDVYHTDMKHPSAIGSYLIAWTIFATVFGEDTRELSYNGSMSNICAKLEKAIAYDVANRDNTPPAEYLTSSVGIKRAEKAKADEGVVDSTKTVMLTKAPAGELLSVITRSSTDTGNGWGKLNKGTGTFSGIRGDKDKISSLEYSDKALTDAQKTDIADIGYGVSVIGIDHMDSSKKGTQIDTNAGAMTSVTNLVNGHWGSSYMAALYFDAERYNIKGEKDASSPYTGLITLNFTEKKTFGAIGYYSGSLDGFSQVQDVYVSDDGINWTKVESACYDARLTALKSVDTAALLDPWNSNKPTVGVFFDMAGASGKYIRIGIISGGNIDSNTTGLMEINTREIAVYAK